MQLWRFLFFYTAYQLAQSTTTLASEVYLYNWDEFLSANVIERLKNEEGITLKQQYFSDKSIRDEVLISERRRSFQLAVIESVKLQTLGKQGIFNNLSGFSHFDGACLVGACGNNRTIEGIDFIGYF